MPKEETIEAKSDNVMINESKAGNNGGGGETRIRVNVKLLDTLFTLAGELVLTRNQLVQANLIKNLQSIDSATQRVNLRPSHLMNPEKSRSNVPFIPTCL